LQGRRHIVAASRTACLKFKHISNRSTNLVAYTYTDLVRAHASTPYSKLDIHVLFYYQLQNYILGYDEANLSKYSICRAINCFSVT